MVGGERRLDIKRKRLPPNAKYRPSLDVQQPTLKNNYMTTRET